MKKRSILSGLILIAAAFMFAGCYTEIVLRSPGQDMYGYSDDQNTQDNQTPADSTYGEQYGDQAYPDSTGGIVNNDYMGGPYDGPYCLGTHYYSGLYWGSSFYDPYYWDPFGLWSPYYYGFYFSPFGFYPYYHNLYYGYGYGNGWGYGYGYGYGGNYRNGYVRTRDVKNLRDNNGTRNIGGRAAVAGTDRSNPVPTTSMTTRNGSTIQRSGRANVSRSGRTISRQQYYQMQRRYYNRSNAYYNSGRNNSSANTQRSAVRSAPQRSGSTSSYSAPRSSGGGQSSARSSGGGGGGGSRSSGGGGRRGR